MNWWQRRFRSGHDRATTYRPFALFGEVFEQVHLEYVDPVSDKALIENAIDGMLKFLDPHSGYMNAECEFREMQEDTAGKFAGLGMEVIQENGFIKVISPIDDTLSFQGRDQGR